MAVGFLMTVDHASAQNPIAGRTPMPCMSCTPVTTEGSGAGGWFGLDWFAAVMWVLLS
jgi:hypothetical protein